MGLGVVTSTETTSNTHGLKVLIDSTAHNVDDNLTIEDPQATGAVARFCSLLAMNVQRS